MRANESGPTPVVELAGLAGAAAFGIEAFQRFQRLGQHSVDFGVAQILGHVTIRIALVEIRASQSSRACGCRGWMASALFVHPITAS